MAVERSLTTGSIISGKEVRENFRSAANSFIGLTETLLGPRGMYKVVLPKEGEPVTTCDCLRVLQTAEVDHPVGRLLYGVANDQSKQYDDGVITSVLLAAQLLDHCYEVVDESGIHPRTVNKGLNQAQAVAEQVLENVAISVNADPNTHSLKAVATAQAQTKLLYGAEFGSLITETLSALAGDARPTKEGGLHLDAKRRSHVFARTGPSRQSSKRFDGILIKKELLNWDNTPVQDAQVAAVDQKLYLETAEGEEESNRRLKASSPKELEELRKAEDTIHKQLVKPLLEVGTDVLVARKGIDDRVSNALMHEGVLVVRRAKPEDILESVAAATNATIVGDVKDITEADLGLAGLVEERQYGPLKYTLIGKCKGATANSILTRGGTWTSAEDTERGLKAALRATATAIHEPAVVPGGAFTEVRISQALRVAAAEMSSQEAIVIEAIAEAFEAVMRRLAANVGLDDLEALTTLRARIPGETVGVVDPLDGSANVGDVCTAGVLDPLRVKRAAVSSALQAAMYAVPIDEVIATK